MAWQKVSEWEGTHQAGKGTPGEGKCKRSCEVAMVWLSPTQGWERSQQDTGPEQAGDGRSSPGRGQPPVVLTTISF